MKLARVLFLGASIVMGGQATMGQQMVDDHHVMIQEKVEHKSSHHKATLTSWFDFIAAAADFGVSWTRITNATLFPDTLVYQLYGATGGGVQLGRTSTHSIGQIFDPKDDYVFFGDPKAISKHNPYLLDSVAFRYRYSHNVPGSVDTLVIQFYNNDKIQRTTLQQSARPTATLSYDRVNNQGSFPTSEIRVLLTEVDTNDWAVSADYNIITVPVPDGGINVVAGGICAATITYRPGYAYNEGDTIQQDWEVPPVKKLNHFVMARYHDNSKLLAAYPSYNTSLMANASSRYTTLVWNNRYIPGHAWNTYDQNNYFFFHITADKVSVPELDQRVHIYPNPSISTPTIIEGECQGASLVVQDAMGRLVKDAGVLKAYNELNLEAGTYFLVFEKDGYRFTKKLIKY